MPMTKNRPADRAATPLTTPGASARVTITTPGDREIRVERVFAAERERVWRALTDPDQIVQWWGHGNRLEVEYFQLERGGHWRYVEHGKSGRWGYEGRFREVTPPSRLVRSFEWDGMPAHVAIETITLEDLGDGRTRVVTTLLCHTTPERDGMLGAGMEGAYNTSYALLDRLLAPIA